MSGSVVLRAGTLTGMGRTGSCEVLARQRRPYRSPDYSEALVLKAAADLPDGDYHVTFDGFEMLCRKSRNVWGLALAYRRMTEAGLRAAKAGAGDQVVEFPGDVKKPGRTAGSQAGAVEPRIWFVPPRRTPEKS